MILRAGVPSARPFLPTGGLALGQGIQRQLSRAAVEPRMTYGDRSVVPTPSVHSPSRGTVAVQQDASSECLHSGM
jgi:hypothetical protein